jgi:hypothetical protein
VAATKVVPDWLSLLGRYLQYAGERQRKVPPPATIAELDMLRTRAHELGLVIAPAMFELLQVVNGTGYDGLTVYGIDIDRDDEFGRLDVFEANDLVEERGDDTLYGQWQDELLVRASESGRFERRSTVTGNVRESFESCDALLAAVFREEVDILDQRAARRKERARGE